MNKPKMLDLFCGCGGCSVGYARAGFEVWGIDNIEQPNYPFTFIKADAMDILNDSEFLKQFDIIHASPPCHKYSKATPKHLKTDKADLVRPVREALDRIGLPYIIENVPQARFAGMRPSLLLSGTMFGLKVIRERIFELSPNLRRFCPQEFVPKPNGSVRTGEYLTCAGMGAVSSKEPYKGKLKGLEDNTLFQNRVVAMGIDWVESGLNKAKMKELANAIPPDYTQWIGERIIKFFKPND